MIKVENWDELEELARSVLKFKNLGQEYEDRLNFEIKEINKQGANSYWIKQFNSRTKFNHNKNGLVLPFLLKLTNIDPIIGIPRLLINNNSENKFKTKGVEIKLENGSIIQISNYTLINTNRGFVAAIDLKDDDEIIID